jgi:hypothetical protein
VLCTTSAAAKLEDGRLKANDCIIAQRQHASGELLAHKAAQHAAMMMKHEALNVEFDHGAVIPLAVGVSSMIFVTSTQTWPASS